MAEAKTSTITIRVPDDLAERVREKAERKAVNVSALIRRSLEQWVDRP